MSEKPCVTVSCPPVEEHQMGRLIPTGEQRTWRASLSASPPTIADCETAAAVLAWLYPNNDNPADALARTSIAAVFDMLASVVEHT